LGEALFYGQSDLVGRVVQDANRCRVLVVIGPTNVLEDPDSVEYETTIAGLTFRTAVMR
jgi:hypothetical protein